MKQRYKEQKPNRISANCAIDIQPLNENLGRCVGTCFVFNSCLFIFVVFFRFSTRGVQKHHRSSVQKSMSKILKLFTKK
jgi:hypothetical protein